MDETQIDLELVKKAQGGNRRAFDAIVVRYQSRLVKLVCRYIPDRSEAADVVQECFIKAYSSLASFRGDSAFYSWLYRIAINTTKTYLINRNRRPPDIDIEYAEVENVSDSQQLKNILSPESLVLTDEIEEAIFHAVEKLPDELRMTIVLREIAGMSYEEIAAALNCPIGTVRSRLARAREIISQTIRAC